MLLRPSLSFCDVGGRLVFLDIAADRYFMLAERDDDLVRATIDRPATAWPDRAATRMAELGLLTPEQQEGGVIAPIASRGIHAELRTPAARSAAPAMMAAAIWRLMMVRRRLHKGQLGQLVVLQRTAQSKLVDAKPKRPLAAALSAFVLARPFAPIRYNCLIDSLALCGFLAAHRHRSTLVMGVRLAPFGAHAWAQQGDALLNDDRERVEQFTPILLA